MAEIAVLSLGVGLATLAFQGTSTAMQAHQMKRGKKKAKANSGLVPYSGTGVAQQSSTNLAPHGVAPMQYQHGPQAQTPADTKPYAYLDGKVNAIPEASATTGHSADGQSGWTTVQKIETIYYFQSGKPTTSDSKFEPLQPTQAYQGYASPPVSPLPSISLMSQTSPAPSPITSPLVMVQQQQPQQWPTVQVSGYIPGQGQISGFWPPASKPLAPPPEYQQRIQVQGRKRGRLRPWT